MFLDKLNYFMSVPFCRNEVEAKKSTARNSFSYAMETLGFVFVMDVNEVEASFSFLFTFSYRQVEYQYLRFLLHSFM